MLVLINSKGEGRKENLRKRFLCLARLKYRHIPIKDS